MNLLYYAITLNSGDLIPGNFYLNNFLLALMEIPGTIIGNLFNTSPLTVLEKDGNIHRFHFQLDVSVRGHWVQTTGSKFPYSSEEPPRYVCDPMCDPTTGGINLANQHKLFYVI